ncbi:hypothetical protein FHS07_001293 [Microbacterium proteolyticum]|uniref:Uncharacterized protein n=1 Tax=Microbacterium proteolyticum TaxID=1572644 RepID=A0A7W5CIS9_9MICO|nr:hypothetical protein [Microbacterium proteolyticum]MBB3157609.1 hypothetical protein [Microbacterium proteolyticum]
MLSSKYLDGVRVRIDQGMPTRRDADGYPDSTPAFSKYLRAAGADVLLTSDQRDLISYNSIEVWLPVASYAVDVISNGLGSALGEIIARLLPEPREKSVVHVDWKFRASNGKEARFKYDGPATAAIDILDRLESIARSADDGD